ncbi:MAG: hypothetical protein ACOCV1_07130 [Bacillota bacterium]
MKSLYLCKTNFFNYKEIKYPPDDKQTKLFDIEDNKHIPQIYLIRENENMIEGNLFLEKKKKIYYPIKSDDKSEIELKISDSFYYEEYIKITNSPFFIENDLRIIEGNSNSIKRLFKITQTNDFKNSFNSGIYLNRVYFDFPKNLNEDLNEDIKGMWLSLKGANINTVGAFGSNVEKHPVIEDIKEDSSIKAINLYIRYKDKTYLYMLTSKGTILFYNKLEDDYLFYNMAYDIYNKFKRYETNKKDLS